MARIALNVSSLAKPDPTGIGRFIAALVPRLLDGGPQHDFRLGLRPNRWSMRDRVALCGLPRDRLRLLVPPYRSLTGRWDLLHSLGLWLPGGRPRFHTIVTVHDLSTVDAPDLFKPGWAAKRATKIREVVPRADFILTPSEFTRSRIVERLEIPAERVRAIPHGIDPDRFHPAPPDAVRPELDALGISPPYMLGTARKGIPELLDAFAEIEDAVPHSLVLFNAFAGEASEIAARRPGSRVRVLDYVSDPALLALYQSADLFAFPSRYEGFGLPILEAMACGTPVIAPDGAVFREVAGSAASLFKEGSQHDLTAALRGVLGDEAQRADLRRRGLARAAEFRWEETARRTLEVYEEVLRTPLGAHD